MKVLIVGAGGQGAACASILSRMEEVEEIRLFDLDESVTSYVAAKIDSNKIITGIVDATDSDNLGKIAIGVDVVVDTVLPWMATSVMKGALKAGAHYINTAFDTPYWDEMLSHKSKEDLTLCKEFKEHGLTALFGCGFAPGWSNILARRLANRLDGVESIRFRVGKASIYENEHPYEWVLRPWNPGWSPKQALIDCASETYALEGGEFVRYKPFGGLEFYDFPAPVGKLPVTHHSHEEIYSIPLTFTGVKDVDFKYYLMMQPAIFYANGLCSQDSIEVKGVEVKPIDVVTALIPKPTDNIFSKTEEELAKADERDFIELAIEVVGSKNGERTMWVANCPKMNAPGPELKRLFGTATVYVSLPLAIGTILLGETAMERGIIFADELDPEKFIERMLGTGYPYAWHEKEIKL